VRRAFALVLCAAAAVAQAQTVTVIDDTGQRVELKRPARRIVSLAPHLTEQLFAIGAGDRIVATTDFADYPPPALRIPRVARAHSVDLERIAAARADLIIVWGTGYPPAVIDGLRRLKVPLYVSEPATLESIATSMERLGVLTSGSRAAEAAAAFRVRLAQLRTQFTGRPTVRVFYQIWAQPLMTLAGSHVINEALRLCGARNVFEQLTAIAPQVGIEDVVVADPQIIITAEPDAQDQGALTLWRRFASVSAVKGENFLVLDANRINRHGPRIVEEVERLCAGIDRVRR